MIKALRVAVLIHSIWPGSHLQFHGQKNTCLDRVMLIEGIFHRTNGIFHRGSVMFSWRMVFSTLRNGKFSENKE